MPAFKAVSLSPSRGTTPFTKDNLYFRSINTGFAQVGIAFGRPGARAKAVVNECIENGSGSDNGLNEIDDALDQGCDACEESSFKGSISAS